MNQKNYLFISGCGRSGTSALTILLGSHPEICLGMERYGHLVTPKSFCIDQSYFKPDRFLDLKPGDTFYSDLLDFHKWCPNISEKIVTASIVGDKRPEYFLVFDKLNEVFDSPKFIHIIRNYSDVAFSWEARAKITKDWPEKKDAVRSITDWNLANEKALEAYRKGYPILVVDYDRIFSSDIESELDRILTFLDASWSGETRQVATSSIRANAARLATEREQRIDSLQGRVDIDSIKKKANTNNYERLLKLSSE